LEREEAVHWGKVADAEALAQIERLELGKTRQRAEVLDFVAIG
jgi:hypothetical protein